MNFDLSDEQMMLAEQTRRLLAEHCGYDHLRALIDADAAWDEALWHEMRNLGFLGAHLPEQYGGLGSSPSDLGVISAEIGRANAALPFFSSMVLCAEAIRLAGSADQKSKWLPRLASGEAIGTMAYVEGRDASIGGSTGPLCYRDGKLTGAKGPVADAGIAHVAVVLCQSNQEPALVLLELDQPGVTRHELQSFDLLRPHYRLELQSAAAEPLDAIAAARALRELLDRAAVQVAFESVGGAEACVYMARDYAMQRQIFGRSLASYQAIKHKLADVLTAVELARSSAYYAGWAASSAPGELPRAAAAARLTALVAFEQAARENLQVHGGIGYTFEANCHFYYRRERTLALSLGGRDEWSDRLIESLLAERRAG